MAKVTITISNVQDSDLVIALEKILSLSGYLNIESEEQREAKDQVVVQKFWEQYEYLQSINSKDGQRVNLLNHSKKPGFIAVNLKQFTEQVIKHKLDVVPEKELRARLIHSRKYAFVSMSKATNSAICNGKAVRCWIFRTPGGFA